MRRTNFQEALYFAWCVYIFGGTTFLVGWKGWSGWWFVLAVLCCSRSEKGG